MDNQTVHSSMHFGLHEIQSKLEPEENIQKKTRRHSAHWVGYPMPLPIVRLVLICKATEICLLFCKHKVQSKLHNYRLPYEQNPLPWATA